MSRTRSYAAAPAPVRTLPGRRPGQRRTPEDNVRLGAAWVLERTLDTLAPSSVFLDSALTRLDERDHPLLRQLALGTLRWLRRLDQVIAAASNRPFAEIEPALLAPLRIAVYQLLFLDGVPPHAAVDEAVEQARRRTHRGGAAFANAVLRRIARSPRLAEWPVEEADPVRRLAIERSHPDFLVERWVERLGRRQTERLLDANNRPKALQLLAFRDRGGRELLAERLIDEGVLVEPSVLSPLGLTVRGGLPLRSTPFREGDFYVQDEASQAAALVPPPAAGERVWDAAAAPGGKSFTLLAWQPDLPVLLSDVSPARLATARANLRRLGRTLPLLVADAARPALAARFDRVVVDLPCSGTGTLRKHPELKWRISAGEIGRLSRQALAMLLGAAERLAPGGLLIAITCSLEPEENEEVVGRFLEQRSGFAPLPLEDRLDPVLACAIAGPGLWRMLPAGDHDGFTVHVLRRG